MEIDAKEKTALGSSVGADEGQSNQNSTVKSIPVSDEKIIGMGRNSPARSLDDPEDETFYDVECLTPDELAGRINDESFAHTEDYVRFINVSPDLLYPDRK